ncbi:MAG: cytochrome c3 family protein [bacterium]
MSFIAYQSSRRPHRYLPLGAAWLVLFFFSPGTAQARFAHSDCRICHGNRLGIGIAVFGQERKIMTINPNTGKPLQRIEAICLACHGPKDEDAYQPVEEDLEDLEADKEKEKIDFSKNLMMDRLQNPGAIFAELGFEPADVGFRVIDLHQTHPVGIIPKTVKLPKEARGFKGEENELTCMGCHNHHPSNPNYMYLRWPTDKGKRIVKLCAHCHPDKVKPSTVRVKKRVKRLKRRMMMR